MKKLILVITILFGFFNCNSNKKEDNNNSFPVVDSIKISTINSIKKEQVILSKIDSVSLSEIKHYSGKKKSIFDYYAIEKIDEVEIWSDKMFGRCCTETDLDYSELLFFAITTNSKNKKYPSKNLSDRKYSTALVFNENENIEILMRLKRKDEYGWHQSQTNLEVDQVLKQTDTLLKPFKLSLVNGLYQI